MKLCKKHRCRDFNHKCLRCGKDLYSYTKNKEAHEKKEKSSRAFRREAEREAYWKKLEIKEKIYNSIQEYFGDDIALPSIFSVIWLDNVINYIASKNNLSGYLRRDKIDCSYSIELYSYREDLFYSLYKDWRNRQKARIADYVVDGVDDFVEIKIR